MVKTTDSNEYGPADAESIAMLWNTPLGQAHAQLLLDRLEIPDRGTLLDLGCGWGELLLRALSLTPNATGVGVDNYLPDIERARTAALDRGLDARATFVEGSAIEWTGRASRVVCIGATHAWGGTASALTALRENVEPGGRVLLGDGFWKQEPTDRAIEMFGDQVLALGDIVRQAHSAGWEVLHLTEADQLEWDDFESTWRLGRHWWLTEHSNAAQASELRDELRSSLLEYVEVYRQVLGFCYLVLQC